MVSGIIVVGTGKWGLNHVSTADSLNVLLAVVDNNAEALKNVSSRLKLSDPKFCSSLAEALNQYPDAGVIIATPPVTHYALAKEALLSNRHVLIEKPFCTELKHAAELVQLAERNNCVLMVDHLLQYSVDHRRLIGLVQSGFVGDVTRIRMSRLNFGTVRLQENVLWSFSPHDISILLSLCHDKLPNNLTCVGQKIVSKGIEDHVDLMLEFDHGVSARIEASWMHPLKERRTIVYGTEGSIILNEASPDPSAKKLQGFKWSAKRKLDGSGVAIEKSEFDVSERADEALRAEGGSARDMAGKAPLQAVVEHFIECAKHRKTPRTDGSEALRVIKVLAAASESLAKGGSKIHMETWTPGTEETESKPYFVHPSAVVDKGAVIGAGSKIWHFSHVMPGARLGENCNIGQNVYIGGKAVLGKNVKVQNNVSIYDKVIIEDDVFLGPSCVFTNVKNPRSHVSRKDDYAKTVVRKGATIGANATIVCGVFLRRYCLVGAGAVVTKDTYDYEVVYGNPAKVHGWVSRSGAKLKENGRMADGAIRMECPETGELYFKKPRFMVGPASTEHPWDVVRVGDT